LVLLLFAFFFKDPKKNIANKPGHFS